MMSPLPLRILAMYLPASMPIFLLSPPMKQVYLSPSMARSRTMTGIPASIASPTGRVRGRDSLGLMMIRSTFCWINSCIWLCWVSLLFPASLKIILISGCFFAASSMSVFIWTRQGSPRLHWDIPMVKVLPAGGGALAPVLSMLGAPAPAVPAEPALLVPPELALPALVLSMLGVPAPAVPAVPALLAPAEPALSAGGVSLLQPLSANPATTNASANTPVDANILVFIPISFSFFG